MCLVNYLVDFRSALVPDVLLIKITDEKTDDVMTWTPNRDFPSLAIDLIFTKSVLLHFCLLSTFLSHTHVLLDILSKLIIGQQ